MLLLFPDPDPILREKPDLNPDPTLNKFGSGSDFTFFLRHKSQYDKYCYTILSLWLLSFADKFHLSWILNIDVQTVIGSNHILKTGSGSATLCLYYWWTGWINISWKLYLCINQFLCKHFIILSTLFLDNRNMEKAYDL